MKSHLWDQGAFGYKMFIEMDIRALEGNQGK